jgi:mannose/fructose/N-acetylgalactosamine-specific phosphotransferase system component IIB
MGKVYVRVDDRLVHGQTVVAWAPTLKIQEIIGVDDVSAANPMLKSIMTMGVPKQYEAHIVNTDEAKKLLSTDNGKVKLVIVKIPHKLTELKEVLKGCEHIYLGNMAKRADTNHQMTGATGIFYLSDEDIKEISTLVDEGFDVSFQQLPNAQEKGWHAFTDTLK